MRHRGDGLRGERGGQRSRVGLVQVDVEPALVRLIDVHVAIVVMVVSVCLGMREDVAELAGSGSREGGTRERLAEHGQKRQEEHQLAGHDPILRAVARRLVFEAAETIDELLLGTPGGRVLIGRAFNEREARAELSV